MPAKRYNLTPEEKAERQRKLEEAFGEYTPGSSTPQKPVKAKKPKKAKKPAPKKKPVKKKEGTGYYGGKRKTVDEKLKEEQNR